MTNLSNLLMLSVLSVSPSFAQDSVLLQAQEKAPFTGILIKPETVQELRRAVIERDGLSQEKVSYERSLELYRKSDELGQKKVDLLLTQNDKLALRLGEERSMSNWQRVGWFSLGIIATGFAGYSLGKIKTSN